MPGPRGALAHPAMASRVSGELERGVPVEDIVGYGELTAEQKEDLSLYLIHRDAAKVAQGLWMAGWRGPLRR